MAVESSFDPNAESSAGAQGLMQVHTRVHTGKFEPFGGAEAAYDPVANIKVGARILSEYVSRYGDVAAGLKAYVGAALLASDGGYSTKVLKRQAEFDAVLRPEPPPALEARNQVVESSREFEAVTPVAIEARAEPATGSRLSSSSEALGEAASSDASTGH
jgi:soluble lytic murein transglycosylase-like protein